MLTGHRFRLLVETLGIEAIDDDHRIAVLVPAGETITVLGGPRPDDKRVVDVQWRDKKLVMFYEDIQKRSDEVRGKSA
jgi:hypothetical protein